MPDDEDLAEMEAWLAKLHEASDDDFRVQVRPYFDSTHEMDAITDREEVADQVRKRYKGRHRA
jgi:hypothetical protein